MLHYLIYSFVYIHVARIFNQRKKKKTSIRLNVFPCDEVLFAIASVLWLFVFMLRVLLITNLNVNKNKILYSKSLKRSDT